MVTCVTYRIVLRETLLAPSQPPPKWAGFQNRWRRMISEIYAWGGFQPDRAVFAV